MTHPVNSGNSQWAIAQVESLKKLGQDVYVLCVNIPGFSIDRKQNLHDLNMTRNYWGDHGFIFNANQFVRFKQSVVINFRNRLCGGFFKCDDIYPRKLSSFVNRIHKYYHFDACIVNYYWMTLLFQGVSFKKTAVNTHDVFSFRNQSVKFNKAWMCTTPNEEAKGLQRAHYIFALQDEESCYFSRIAPSSKVINVYCPFMIHDMPIVQNHTLTFLSSDNHFNIEGLKWFNEVIFPSIIDAFPDVVLVVGGKICNAMEQANKHMMLIGPVDRPEYLYKYGDVAINPCINGTGLKIKTFESMAYGKVVLVHPHSTIGIYKKTSAPVLASSNPEDWVSFLKKIWGNIEILKEYKNKSINYIEEMNHYIDKAYLSFIED